MAPYNPSVVKDLVADAIRSAPRGTQTRLAEALDVNVQTVNKWAQKHTAPDMVRWPALERFFGWPSGRIARESGLEIAASVFEVGDLRFEGPPDFIVETGENVVFVVNVDKSDPVWEKLQANVPKPTRSQPARDVQVNRLRQMLDGGEAVQLRLAGSDAEVYAIKMPADADEKELPMAAEKGKATGARKARPRRPKPKAET